MDALLCKDALAFLGKVMRVAIDLINLSPVIGLDNDILNRVWIGKDVCYDHVIVFSCRAYVHFLKDEISKLDDEATPCIFIYRVWPCRVCIQVVRSSEQKDCQD